jgi:DNA-binding NarL/FixJ family response regulator
VRSTERPSRKTTERPSRKISVALACAEVDWPHDDWPAPDDPYVDRVVLVTPPYLTLRTGEVGQVDVVVLYCAEPAESFPMLLAVLGDRGAPVVVVSSCTDTGTVVDVFQAGAGYMEEGDYCPHMLSSAAMAASLGHTYLSPAACVALREGALRMSTGGDVLERLRALLSPRERQVMELLSTGLGAQEIGLRLRLSEKTVRNNLSNIYAKLDARGSTDAVLRWLGATPATPVLRT